MGEEAGLALVNGLDVVTDGIDVSEVHQDIFKVTLYVKRGRALSSRRRSRLPGMTAA